MTLLPAKKTFYLLAPCSLAIGMLTGCAHQPAESTASYDAIPSSVNRPTSDGRDQRVYSGTVTAPNGGSATITRNADGAPAASRDVAETIRQMILSDRTLVPYPGKVMATTDGTSDNRVVLTGNVPSEAVKERLVEKVRAVRGVSQVKDKLVVGFPKSSREVDLSAPEK
jgi:BON domain-containing protein